MSHIPGFDISKWQGKFDFARAASDGYKFCFVKASEGASHTDGEFVRNWSEARAHGLLVGAYHFFRPSVDPLEQAENHLRRVGSLSPGHLPCVLDWEVTDGVRNAEQIHGAKVWLETVHARTGRLPIIYTGPSFVKERGGLADFSVYPLWLAHYTVGKPKVPVAWPRWTFWQYSSAGHLDKNLFNGTLSELNALAGIAQIS